MRNIFLLFIGLIFTGLAANAQTHAVEGHVTSSDGSPLIGITVQVKGSGIATATDSKGDFKLNVNPNATLVFTGIGFEEQSLDVGNRSEVNVSMVSSTQKLSEVVVTGYSTSTKEAFTGSAKVVSGEQLSKKDVSNISQALAGEVAGVRVVNTSGQPGTSATIRIRGIGSVNGNRDPLYVVNGVAYS